MRCFVSPAALVKSLPEIKPLEGIFKFISEGCYQAPPGAFEKLDRFAWGQIYNLIAK